MKTIAELFNPYLPFKEQFKQSFLLAMDKLIQKKIIMITIRLNLVMTLKHFMCISVKSRIGILHILF